MNRSKMLRELRRREEWLGKLIAQDPAAKRSMFMAEERAALGLALREIEGRPHQRHIAVFLRRVLAHATGVTDGERAYLLAWCDLVRAEELDARGETLEERPAPGAPA